MRQQTTSIPCRSVAVSWPVLLRFSVQLTSGAPWLVLAAKGASAVRARLMPSHLPNKNFQCSQDCAPGTSSPSTASTASRFASACRGVAEFRGLLGICGVAQAAHGSPTLVEHSTGLQAGCSLSLILSAQRTSTHCRLGRCCHNAR